MRARASSNWRWNASQSTFAEVYVTLDWLGTVAVTASPHSCLDRFQRDRMGTREPGHQLLDFLLGDDERWRHGDQIAVHAIRMADVGPHDEPSPMGRLGERLDELRRAWERGAGGLVFHELDPREQPTPPHVAHVGQLDEGSEAALQDSAELGAPLDEAVSLEQPNRGESGPARAGAKPESLAVQQAPRAGAGPADDPLGRGHRRQRGVAA